MKMKVLFLVVLGLGLSSAAPLSDSKRGDADSAALKKKLGTLRELLGQLNHKVQEKVDEQRALKTKEEEKQPFLRDLNSKDVAILKGMGSQYKHPQARQTFETSGSLGEPDFVELDPHHKSYGIQGMRDYFKDLKNKEDEEKEKREEEDDVRELLQKFKSRAKYLRAALEDEEKRKESKGPQEGSDKQSRENKVEGTFGQFEDDKRVKEEWKDQPIPEYLLGGQTVGTKYVNPDGKNELRRALANVEKRLLNDLKYAHEHGVDVRQILKDLKDERQKA